MDIDARLGVVPTTTAAVHKAACLSTTVIRIFGVEDIVDLAHEADIGGIILLAAFLHWQ